MFPFQKKKQFPFQKKKQPRQTNNSQLKETQVIDGQLEYSSTYNIIYMKQILPFICGVIVVVIAWYMQLNLQLPVQSLPTCITTKVVSQNPIHDIHSIQHYMIKFASDFVTGWWLSLHTHVFSTNKTDHHDITDRLLKVALKTIN